MHDKNDDLGISVKELLETKYLRNICKVVAGQNGLHKKVSWVHILEIRDVIKESVNGNELILTTGIGFTSEEVALNFITELFARNVTALCIETALYYHTIDDTLIRFADENDFPLIEIMHISRFLEITKGLNTMILNKEAEIYQFAGDYDVRLSEMEGKGSIIDGIRYTAEYLNVEIAYIPNKGRSFSTSREFGEDVKRMTENVKNKLDNDEIYSEGKIAIKNLKIFERDIGYLIFKSKKLDLSQFDLLILGRLSNKIKQDAINQILKKEAQYNKDQEWLRVWLKGGEITDHQIKQHLIELSIPADINKFVVCSTELPKGNNINHKAEDSRIFDLNHHVVNDFFIHTITIVKGLFEEKKLQILGYMNDLTINYIIMGKGSQKEFLIHVKQAVEDLRDTENPFFNYKKAIFSLGKIVKRRVDLYYSFNTSIDLLQNKYNDQKLLVYDYMHINRIMKLLDQDMLDELIQDYLGELLETDNVILLKTLKAYYECNCSKQKTADMLFIARQTLYFRLQKIEDILGVEYEEGEKRFVLEFVVNCYFYKIQSDFTE